MPSEIRSFSGEYRWLSNFHIGPYKIRMGTEVYRTVEHAFQAAKCADYRDREQFWQPNVTPGQAKRLGRKVLLRPNWDSVKVSVMECLLREKFRDPNLKQELVDTCDAELIEGNTWGDRFWGIDGTGENHLGKLLMKIRNEYIEESKEVPRRSYEFDSGCPEAIVRFARLVVPWSNGETPSVSIV